MSELTPLQTLAGKELIVTFTGQLQRNDITEEFEKAAQIALDSISLDLNTDEDFEVAKGNVNACKETEDKLKKLKADIISGNEDIAKVEETLSNMILGFGIKRTTLKKKIKDRKTEKKKEITDAGKKELVRVVSLSEISNVFIPNNRAIDDAIKNKSLYSVMEDCVSKVVIEEIERLAWMELSYIRNIKLIEKSLINFPGIYPDKGLLARESTDKLELIIQAREDKQTLLLKEQAEKAAVKKLEDERIAKEKAEQEEKDRLAKIEADRTAEEERKAKEVKEPPVVTPQEQAKVEYPPLTTERAKVEEPTFTAPPSFTAPPPIQEDKTYTITFTLTGSKQRMDDLCRNLGKSQGVSNISIM